MNKKIEITNKIFICTIIIITIFAVLIRIPLIHNITVDYKVYLEKWFEELKSSGGILGITNDIGNYNFPYLTILGILTYFPVNSLISIKAVSIIFDFALAIASMILVSRLVKEDKKYFMLITYFLILFLPTVTLNSAYWAQCDSIYTFFVIVSLIKLIDKKHVQSFIYLGIAFSFKLQAVFIIPMYIIYFMKEKENRKKLYYFFIIPIMNVIMCLPYIIIKKDKISVLKVYFNQTQQHNDMISLNLPNIYTLICKQTKTPYLIVNSNEWLSKVMVIITISIFFILLVLICQKKKNINDNNILLLGLISVLICTFLLPFMHERYMYVADVLSVILSMYYFSKRDYKKVLWPISIQIISLCSYIAYFSGYSIHFIDRKIFTILYITVICTSIMNFFLKQGGNLKDER